MNDSSINKKDFYKMVDQNYKDHNFVYYHNLNKELGICKAEIMELE